MTDTPRSSVFLERRSYRRRRMMDAARFMPILGALLFAVPLLWPRPDGAAGEIITTSQAMIYIFGVWSLLIVLAVLFGTMSRNWVGSDSPHGSPPRSPPQGRSAPGPIRKDG